MEKLIVNFTPTGMVPMKEDNPSVPVSTEEIVEQVHEAYEMGITIAHLHARDTNGAPTHKRSVYARIFEGVKMHCPDLIVCASLSGRDVSEVEKRTEVLDLQPDMGSLTLGSLNFTNQASVNSPQTILSLIERMKATGTVPELECFGFGMVNYAKYLMRKGVLTGPHYFNIIVGNLFGIQAEMQELGAIIERLPQGSLWSLGGIGASQLRANALAVACGGGVRVGLEDNLWEDKGKTQLATNLSLLRRVHRLAEIHERVVMSPSELGQQGFYNANRKIT